MRRKNWMAANFVTLVAALILATAISAESTTVISDIDLSKPFATHEDWHFIATQGPPFTGDKTVSDDQEPGEIQLCLRVAPSAPCDPQLQNTLASGEDDSSQPHYLNTVKIVYPRGSANPPLLFIQTGSLYSDDGDQLRFTQVLAYENSKKSFVRIYQFKTWKNNNQEVRYIDSGKLMGDIISVIPTEDAPYSYWVTVNALTPQYSYKEVLHYRSATHYNDTNPLRVIDSEMPNIQQRLGFWKPGMPLPLPAGHCLNPHLIHMELWCN